MSHFDFDFNFDIDYDFNFDYNPPTINYYLLTINFCLLPIAFCILPKKKSVTRKPRSKIITITVKIVGVRRLELPTPCTPCKCASQLRHTPNLYSGKDTFFLIVSTIP